jgi:hypothetical protein
MEPPLPGNGGSVFLALLKPSKKRGVKGCTPWAASPFGGERGSPSKQPIRESESQKNRISTEPFFLFFREGLSRQRGSKTAGDMRGEKTGNQKKMYRIITAG